MLHWSPVSAVSVQKKYFSAHTTTHGPKHCPRNPSKGSRIPLCSHETKYPRAWNITPSYFFFSHSTYGSRSRKPAAPSMLFYLHFHGNYLFYRVGLQCANLFNSVFHLEQLYSKTSIKIQKMTRFHETTTVPGIFLTLDTWDTINHRGTRAH